MRAWGFRAYGGPERLEEIAVAEPHCGASELVVEVASMGLNPLDYHFRRGQMGPVLWRGARATGCDFAGRVLRCGSRVSRWKPGDLVMGMSRWGTAVERLAVKAKHVAAVPKGMDLSPAATVPLAALTAYQMLYEKAQLKPGQRVLVNGASGGVGCYVVQLAKMHGAHVTTVSSARNGDWLRQLGADEVLDYNEVDCCELDRRFDAFLDCYCNRSFAAARKVLTADGVFVSLAVNAGLLGQPVLNLFRSQACRSVVVRSNGMQLGEIAGWIEAGRLRVEVQAVYPSEGLHEAFASLETKHTRGKIAVELGFHDF